jgi:hypothetical protein
MISSNLVKSLLWVALLVFPLPALAAERPRASVPT